MEIKSGNTDLKIDNKSQESGVIDHLVYATPDLDLTIASLTSEWGVAFVEGGPHVGRGTRNWLTGLGGGTYLEVIGPDHEQPTPQAPRPFGIDGLEEPGLVAWCARSAEPLDSVLAAGLACGVDLGAISDMSRRRPDGVLLSWRLTVATLTDPTIPFFIDWLDSPHPAATLPTTAVLAKLELRHPDPTSLTTFLSATGLHDSRITTDAGSVGLAAELTIDGKPTRLT